METIVLHLDVVQIFCDVDDFCQQFERLWAQQSQLPSMQWGETEPIEAACK